MEFYDPTSEMRDSWTDALRASYWDSRAKRYNADFNKADVKARIAETIADWVARRRVRRILDIGIGCGQLTFEVRRHQLAEEYYGIDFSTRMVDVALEYALSAGMTDVSFEVGDARTLPFEDSYFDAVVSSMTLHHLENSDKRISLREIRRVLVPDGLFVVGDLLFSFCTDDFSLEQVRKKVQRTFFPTDPPEKVAARFRDEPKEWPVSVWEYQALMCQEGFIVRQSIALNDVVSIIAAVAGR